MKILKILFLLTLATPLLASVSVNKINVELEESGAQWKAKENWMTKLTRSELVGMMGSLEVPTESLDLSDAYEGQKSYESIDWRNHIGINWLGDVMNQGNCGSCVAFAAVATMEAQMSITNGQPWFRPSLSPQSLFACGGGKCQRGWFPSSAASYLKKKGTVDLACAPYESGSTGEDLSCKKSFCSDQSERTYKVNKTHTPTSMWSRKISKVKEALKKGPLMTTMTVYADFIAYSKGIYKSNGRNSLGGHAVSLVGYSDEGRYWIIRNSWGVDWGEDGYARISWDDRSGIASSTIGFYVNQNKDNLVVTSPKANEYVTGDTPLVVKFSSPKNNNVKFKVRSQSTTNVESAVCTNMMLSTCELELASDTLADGTYEIWAESVDGKIKSIIQNVIVLNDDPKFAVTFDSGPTDLSRPVKGRLEFNVQTKTASVNPQLIDFVVERPDGSTALVRSYDVVLTKMKLGFRTNKVPNGDYTIYYRVSALDYSAESKRVNIQINN